MVENQAQRWIKVSCTHKIQKTSEYDNFCTTLLFLQYLFVV